MATIKWIDPQGQDVPTGDTANYSVDTGSFNTGDQTTKLTLKSTLVANINTATTYKCSVSSGKYSDSEDFKQDVVVTPIGEFYLSGYFILCEVSNLPCHT